MRKTHVYRVTNNCLSRASSYWVRWDRSSLSRVMCQCCSYLAPKLHSSHKYRTHTAQPTRVLKHMSIVSVLTSAVGINENVSAKESECLSIFVPEQNVCRSLFQNKWRKVHMPNNTFKILVRLCQSVSDSPHAGPYCQSTWQVSEHLSLHSSEYYTVYILFCVRTGVSFEVCHYVKRNARTNVSLYVTNITFSTYCATQFCQPPSVWGRGIAPGEVVRLNIFLKLVWAHWTSRIIQLQTYCA